MDPLNFDSLEPIVVLVTIAGESYQLREASAKAGGRYRGALISGLDNEGASRRLDSIEIDLVSSSLTKKGAEDNWIPVSPETVAAWPDKIVHKLFDKLKEISKNLMSDENPTQANS